MLFQQRWLLILSLLVLGGGQLWASPSREERTYAAALAEFHDGIYDRAQADLASFVLKYPKSTNAATAVLFRAQAFYELKQFDNAIQLLTDSNQVARAEAAGVADRYLDWLGKAQLARNDLAAAANTWLKLAQGYPDSPLALNAVVAAASARNDAEEWSQVDALLEPTNSLLVSLSQRSPQASLANQAALLLANSKNQQGDFAAAYRVLQALDIHSLSPDQYWGWAVLRYRNRLGVDDTEGRLTAATNLVQASAVLGANQQAQAWSALASSLEKQGQGPFAQAVWEKNLAPEMDATYQQEAAIKLASGALSRSELAYAVSKLNGFLARYPNAPAAGTVELTLGELYLRQAVAANNDPDELQLAGEAFNHLLLDTNGPQSGRAYLYRGWCRWLTGQYADCQADFLAAADRLPPEEQAVARFKAGDALFQLGRLPQARQQYELVTNAFALAPAVEKSLGDLTLYQILRTDLLRTNLNEAGGAVAQATMNQLLQRFPHSELQDKSLLITGESLANEQARAVFDLFVARVPESPLRSEVDFAVARTFEREQNWPAAITNYERWLANHATNELRLLPKVKYALALAHYHAGQEAEAFQLFSAFLTEFPTNELAPYAQWWVADHFFNAINFAGGLNFGMAETNYENIFQNPAWRNSGLYYKAQLMAGRAAMARLGFSDAISSYFSKLLADTNCPADIREPARFAYAHALMQLMQSEVLETNKLAENYQLALGLLEQVRQVNPTNLTAALAWAETADLQLQMNDLAGATNSYAQVLNSPTASVGLRNRVQVGQGLALEKMAESAAPEMRQNLLKAACDDYREVVYSKDPQVNLFWVKKAGLQYLALANRTGALDRDDLNKLIDRLEKILPQLKSALELKRPAAKS
jgi:TolA-binding protein